MLENDIEVNAIYNNVNKSYTYSAKYLLEGDVDTTSNVDYTIPRANTAYNLSNKYIQTYVQSIENGSSILLLKVDLVQIEKISTVYPIIENDIISMTGLDFQYTNKLSHFNIYYRK